VVCYNLLLSGNMSPRVGAIPGFAQSRSDQIGMQANPPSPCGWSVANGFMSENLAPLTLEKPTLISHFYIVDMIPLSVLPPFRCHSKILIRPRGFLLRHPHRRRPPLRPLHHRYRRPGGVPWAMVCLDPELRCVPLGLRYHQPVES
jgi:hypothetical protein